MTLYIIRGDTVTAYASPPARGLEDEFRVRSAKEIEVSRLTNAQMAAIWNALPGTAPVTKFKDRKTAVQRLWVAFGQLPVASEPVGGSAGRRAGSKQARVIRLLQRPEGATSRLNCGRRATEQAGSFRPKRPSYKPRASD